MNFHENIAQYQKPLGVDPQANLGTLPELKYTQKTDEFS